MITENIRKSCVSESRDYFLIKHPERAKLLGEVFTPTPLVLEILSQLPKEVWEPGKTYLDPTCGNGQFLAPVLLIKQALGHTNPLATIYGVDIMQDNVDETRQRLIDIVESHYKRKATDNEWAIVRNNIRCEDGLKYDYSFDPLPPAVDLKAAVAPKKQKKEKPKAVETDWSTFGQV